jgi:hypothetical protein
MESICHTEWYCRGNALSPNQLNRIVVPCNLGFFQSEISYVEGDKLMLQGLTAATTIATSIARNEMTLEASAALEPQNIPKQEICISRECTWANITMPVRGIQFRWQLVSFRCHPDYCGG